MTRSGWRRAAIVCLLLACAAAAQAGAVDPRQAAAVAQNHILRYGAPGEFTLGAAQPVPNAVDGTLLYYRFDLQPCGYVIVSGSLDLPPVLAYSFAAEAGADSDSPLARLLHADVASRIAHAADLPVAVIAQRHAAWARLGEAPEDGRVFEQWPAPGSTPTGGWVLTRWNQSAPYNNLCPMDTVHGQRSVAGCPAVAMAQILHYHARLNGTRFDDADDYYHNYGGNGFWIDDDYVARSFPSFPQLNTHLTTLFNSYHYGTTPTNTTIAALIFACGVAAEQVYSSSGSGTFGVDQALDAFRKFRCSTAELLYQSSPGPYARLAQNMMDGYPAHLAVVDPGWSYGHNLVVDGYNTDGYYHLNFGWGGAYDGWFLLPSELPMSLTVVEGIIVDIMIDDCRIMDCNCDGFVAWDDFTYLAGCLTGPAGGLNARGCASFDSEPDSDADLRDFATFQQLYAG